MDWQTIEPGKCWKLVTPTVSYMVVKTASGPTIATRHINGTAYPLGYYNSPQHAMNDIDQMIASK